MFSRAQPLDQGSVAVVSACCCISRSQQRRPAFRTYRQRGFVVVARQEVTRAVATFGFLLVRDLRTSCGCTKTEKSALKVEFFVQRTLLRLLVFSVAEKS